MLSWLKPGSCRCCRWLCCSSRCINADSRVSLRGLQKRSHVLGVCTGEPAQEQQRKRMKLIGSGLCRSTDTQICRDSRNTVSELGGGPQLTPRCALDLTESPGTPTAQTSPNVVLGVLSNAKWAVAKCCRKAGWLGGPGEYRIPPGHNNIKYVSGVGRTFVSCPSVRAQCGVTLPSW